MHLAECELHSLGLDRIFAPRIRPRKATAWASPGGFGERPVAAVDYCFCVGMLSLGEARHQRDGDNSHLRPMSMVALCGKAIRRTTAKTNQSRALARTGAAVAWSHIVYDGLRLATVLLGVQCLFAWLNISVAQRKDSQRKEL